MPLTNIAALVLRFFTFSWLIAGISGFIPMLFSWGSPDLSLETGAMYGIPLLYLILAFFIWRFAPQIAQRLVRGIDANVTLSSLTRSDLYCFAFVIVGLWYILSSIPNALNWLHYLLKSVSAGTADPLAGQGLYQVSQCLISIILGFACLLGAKRWADLLIKNEKT
jgi:hypothetical protein